MTDTPTSAPAGLDLGESEKAATLGPWKVHDRPWYVPTVLDLAAQVETLRRERDEAREAVSHLTRSCGEKELETTYQLDRADTLGRELEKVVEALPVSALVEIASRGVADRVRASLGSLAREVEAKDAEIAALRLAQRISAFGRRHEDVARWGYQPYGIYMASKTKHAHRWRALRDELGLPINSTWIDEAGVGETSNFANLWSRCITEAGSAQLLIIVREGDDILKGAWAELGAALSRSVPVYAVGIRDFTIAQAEGITHFDTVEAAIIAIPHVMCLARANGEKGRDDGR